LLVLVLSGLLVTVGVVVLQSRATSASVKPAMSGSGSASGSAASSPSATGGVSPSPSATPSPTPTPTPFVSTLHVLALGDSVTAGTNCDCDAFPTVYAHSLGSRTGDTVRLSNQGQNGATSADVLAYLRSSDGAAAAQQSDVILLTIGANDFNAVAPKVLTQTCGGDDDLSCTRAGLAQLALNLNAIMARLHQLRGDQPTRVLVTDYWNVFEDGDVGAGDYDEGYLAWSDRVTRDANAVICQAADLAAASCVDLYQPFKGADGRKNPTPLLADDGDHPNQAGTRLVATVLAAAVERRGSLG
jgi:lysophospholipase L1-like esterase